MSRFPQLALLGICAAAGIGVAISVGLGPDLSRDDVPGKQGSENLSSDTPLKSLSARQPAGDAPLEPLSKRAAAAASQPADTAAAGQAALPVSPQPLPDERVTAAAHAEQGTKTPPADGVVRAIAAEPLSPGRATQVQKTSHLAPVASAATAAAVGQVPALPGAAAEGQETNGAKAPANEQLQALWNLVNKLQEKQSTPAGLPQPQDSSGEEPSQPASEANSPPAVRAEQRADAGSLKEKARFTGRGDGDITATFAGEDLRGVLELLSEQSDRSILASKNVQGTVSATLKHVSFYEALDAILKSTGYIWQQEGNIIHVGTPRDFALMEQAGDRIGTRLYRPNYIRAADLQVLITPLLTPEVGTISVTSAAQIGIASDASTAEGDNFAGQEALLVRDYQTVLLQIDQIIEQVDRRPTQVAIEAMILSVNLDDENELGVDFEFLLDRDNIRLTTGNPLGNLAAIDTSDGGLKVGFLDSSLGGFLNALETVGDTNVIATPRLMCLNKHKAEILIGEQLGYVSTTQTETSTTQSVEFLEVGTQLRIRPFISSDGLIRMEVHPELSTGNVRLVGDFTLPDKQVTQVTTNIMVRDGCTVVIGGLLRDELTATASQIPLLGSMPVLGPVFRKNTESTRRQEILVLITPRIVYEPRTCCEGDRQAGEFHHRHAVFADQMIPFGKRYLGRKYLRFAQQAWDAGDGAKALRMINLAIHFDPMNRAAIDLRADIWAGKPRGQHTLHPPPAAGAGQALDNEAVPQWILDRLGNQAVPHLDHPLDAGRPGSKAMIGTPRIGP